MTVDEMITEIHNAEKAIENYARFYHSKETECPISFKFLMLINEWRNPFNALSELLKRIYTNELLLKREKTACRKFMYKSRYKEMRELIQKAANDGTR